jgi:SAM-dependent MidA family methyltransferase
MQLSLSEIIQSTIQKEGPISFRDFMEMALYYPELGYYTSTGDKIGKEGDFYTSPYLTNAFGHVIARQLEEMWQLTGTDEFVIVEYGAGMGSLCIDILSQLKANKKLYDKLKYCILEKSEAMRTKEQNAITNSQLHEKVYWYNSINEIPSFTGCVIANEVVDNFSVHKVVMVKDELMEVFVGYNNGFVDVLKPAPTMLKDYFKQLEVQLPVGFCTEVNLQAIDWIKNISASLNKGFVLTIDYGYPSSELYQSNRRLGTIACYNKHTVNDLPYTNIGQQDITTHVNFSALNFWGAKNGLMTCGFTNQSQFLLSLGLAEYVRKIEETEKNNFEAGKKLSILHNLLISMGRKMKVLVQQKGLKHPFLSGLRFTQPLT